MARDWGGGGGRKGGVGNKSCLAYAVNRSFLLTKKVAQKRESNNKSQTTVVEWRVNWYRLPQGG